MRRFGIAAAIAFAIASIAAVGVAGASWLFEDSNTVRFTIAQPVVRVAVEGGGDVDVATTSRSVITVERRSRSFVVDPGASWRVVDGVLRLESRCREHWGFVARCRVDYEVALPEGIPIAIETAHGDVDVRGSTGELVVETQHGDVRAHDLDASVVRASSSHGDVELALVRPPDVVRAESDHGDVAVTVPPGEYVDASTDHGDVAVEGIVRNDRSPRSIAAHADHGDVSVSAR